MVWPVFLGGRPTAGLTGQCRSRPPVATDPSTGGSVVFLCEAVVIGLITVSIASMAAQIDSRQNNAGQSRPSSTKLLDRRLKRLAGTAAPPHDEERRLCRTRQPAGIGQNMHRRQL